MLEYEEAERSLLQNGYGIDHLVVAVKNLQSSRDDYANRLGFTMTAGGRHPGGTENSLAGFEDQTYLELLGLYDPKQNEFMSGFLEKHEGGVSLGLNTGSAEKTVEFLKSRGFNPKTGEGTIKLEEMNEPPPTFWRWVDINDGTPLSNNIFLIEYTPARTEYRRNHPEHYSQTTHGNTAKHLSTVWIAVWSIDEPRNRYEHLGLSLKGQVDLPQLNAKGLELQAGHGTILLLAPTGEKGEIVRFLAQRGEGVIGASIEVASLTSCKRVFANSGIGTETINGLRGESLMVNQKDTHGLFLEMFQGH